MATTSGFDEVLKKISVEIQEAMDAVDKEYGVDGVVARATTAMAMNAVATHKPISDDNLKK